MNAELATPRTDHCWSVINIYGPADRAVKMMEFAKELEREIVRLRDSLKEVNRKPYREEYLKP